MRASAPRYLVGALVGAVLGLALAGSGIATAGVGAISTAISQIFRAQINVNNPTVGQALVVDASGNWTNGSASSSATTLLDTITSTRGSILYRGASAWAGLAPGASGTVLTSNGPGTDPSWQTAGGSGWTDDGTVVRLTTSTDQVGIGTSTPTAGSKITIVGDATLTDIVVTGGTPAGAAQGGGLTFTSGDGGSGGGVGGKIDFAAGDGQGSATGGALEFDAGGGGDTGEGGPVTIRSGGGGGTSGDSGPVTIQSGDVTGGSGSNSGTVTITTGSGEGSGNLTISTGASAAGNGGNVVLAPATAASGISGRIQFNARYQGQQGADVASGTNIALTQGNYFDITGTTTINTISATGWRAGSVVMLQFDASVTVTHNGAGTGASILLTGAANFSATAGDTLTLVYDGTTWRETARAVI